MYENEKKTWKQKLADNAPDIAFWGTMTACIVGYFGLVGYAVKKQSNLLDAEAQRAHELTMQQDCAKNEALARGAQILPKGDGSYYFIEKDGRVA
jgi:hypothetical protein